MEVRDALMAVADLFERKPTSYNFHLTSTPEDEECPGCVIGHVARLCSLPWRGPAAVLDVHDGTFYSRMDALETEHRGESVEEAMTSLSVSGDMRRQEADWTQDATLCVVLLKKYVEKYHPVVASGG